MAEPAIVDYYNELPQGVNVIEKLNKEYDDLDNKYQDIKPKYDKLYNERKRIYSASPHIYNTIVNDKNVNLKEFKTIEKNNNRNIKTIITNSLEEENRFINIFPKVRDNLYRELPKFLSYLFKDNNMPCWNIYLKIIKKICKVPFFLPNDTDGDDLPCYTRQVGIKIYDQLSRNELISIMVAGYEKALRKIKNRYCVCECHMCKEETPWNDDWGDFDKFTCVHCIENYFYQESDSDDDPFLCEECGAEIV